MHNIAQDICVILENDTLYFPQKEISFDTEDHLDFPGLKPKEALIIIQYLILLTFQCSFYVNIFAKLSLRNMEEALDFVFVFLNIKNNDSSCRGK